MKIEFNIDDKKLVEALNECKLKSEPDLTIRDLRRVDAKLAKELSQLASWMVLDHVSCGNDDGALTQMVMERLGYSSGEE